MAESINPIHSALAEKITNLTRFINQWVLVEDIPTVNSVWVDPISKEIVDIMQTYRWELERVAYGHEGSSGWREVLGRTRLHSLLLLSTLLETCPDAHKAVTSCDTEPLGRIVRRMLQDAFNTFEAGYMGLGERFA